MPRALAPWRSFRWKLYGVFAGLVILVAALGMAGHTQLATVEGISTDVADTASAHGLAQELAILLADLDAHLGDYLVIGDGPSRARVESDLEDLDAKLRHLQARDQTSSEFAELVDRALDGTAALRDHIEEFLALESDEVGVRNLLVVEIYSHLTGIRQQYNDLSIASLDRVDRSLFSQGDILSRFSFQLLALGVLIMLVLIGTSLYVGRIVRSIGIVTDTATAIAAGDLSREVPVQRRDEIGVLARAFNSMTGQMRGYIDGLEERVETRTAELVETNEELLRAKEFAETVLNSMTESIAIVDIEDFSIVGANKVFTEMADARSVEELIGLTCYTVTHERSDPCCPPDDICPLLELQAGASPAAVEHVHRGPNGDKRYVEVSVSPIRDDNGSVARVVHVSRDITERKLAEEELRNYATRLEATEARLAEANRRLQSSNRRLERLVESKDEFLASVSHELRTPLTAIVGFADYLKHADLDLDPEERAGIVETICNEGADVANLIEDLLTSARADIGRLEVSTVPVDLLAQARQVVEGLGDRASDVTIVGEATPVAADPSRVRQIIRNLLTNAARYGGPHVVVRVVSAGEMGMLSVADDGAGIPDEDRDRVFQPYERAHDGVRVPDSVGIGLPVSRRLARLMSGDITYRREEGESAFELTLPLYGSAPPMPSGSGERQPAEAPR